MCACLPLRVAAEILDLSASSKWTVWSNGVEYTAPGIFSVPTPKSDGNWGGINWTGGELPANADWTVQFAVILPSLPCTTSHYQMSEFRLQIVPHIESSTIPAFSCAVKRLWSDLSALPGTIPSLTFGYTNAPSLSSSEQAGYASVDLLETTAFQMRVSFDAKTKTASFYCQQVLRGTVDLSAYLTACANQGITSFSLAFSLGGFDLMGTSLVNYLSDGHATLSELIVVGAAGKPQIVGQPLSTWSLAGSSASLAVQAAGEGLSYQWYKGASGDVSNPVAGATSASLTPLAAGSYWVRVRNSYGTTDSFSAAYRTAGTEISDAFDNQSKWVVSHTIQAAGDLVVAGNALSFVTASGSYGEFSVTGAPMLPSDKDWSAEVDVHVPASSFSSSSDFLQLSMGLTPAKGQSHLGILQFSYQRYMGEFDLVPVANFSSGPFLPGTLGSLLSPDVRMRIDYIAATHVMTYALDPDGAAGPQGYQACGQKNIQPEMTTLGIKDDTGFLLFLAGAGSVPVTQGTAYFKNFKVRTAATGGTAPVITVQPQAQTVIPGEPFTVSLSATGSNLRYEWFGGEVGDVREPLLGALGHNTNTVTLPAANVTGKLWALVYNEAGVVCSQAAQITLDPTKYAGVYLGSFKNDPSTYGAWALYVRPDNTGLFVGYTAQDKLLLRAEVVVKDDGTFSGSITQLSASSVSSSVPIHSATDLTTSVPPEGERPRAPVVDGTIKPDGNGGTLVSLTTFYDKPAIGSVSLSGSGELYPYIGTHLAFSGLYELSAVNGPKGLGYAVVSPIGHAYYLVVTARGVAYGVINVGVDGRFTDRLSDGSLLEGMVDEATGMLDARVISGTEIIEFIGRSIRKPSTSRLSNLSINTQISSTESVTAGFIVKGTSKKSLLMRGVGPALGELGVLGDNWQRDTSLVLNRISGGLVLGENKGWGSFSSNPSVFQANNAFTGLPFLDNSGDSALVGELADSAGGYTIEVKTSQAVARTAMAEIYEADTDASTRLKNLSALKRLTGNAVLTAGFVISGNTSKRVLIRAVGPSLANYGVPSGYLPNPKLKVFSLRAGASSLIGENNDWWDTTDANTLADATTKSEAGLVLATGSADAAIAMTLKPGMYSIEMTSADGREGIGLIEVYEAD